MNGATSNQVCEFETLENRSMLSAVLHVAAKPVKALPHSQVIKTVNPVTTSKSITYASFATDPLFASTGPMIADINQGELGDCYLLATLSSIVKTDPALIRKDFVADGNGIYSVKFSGTTVNVSADLPVFANGHVAYAQLGTQNSLWVALIEKAYVQYKNAKADSYVNIQGGWMGDVFSALSLKSQNLFSASSATSLMSTLQSDLRTGDFVTIGTIGKLPTTSPLVADHAYEVDAVHTSANGTATLTLRNPWGDAVADDGYITITAQQAYLAFGGAAISHA